MFKWWQQPWGENWYDLAFLILWALFTLSIIVYVIKKYRLQFPPWRPLALLCFAFWSVGMLFGGLYALVWYFDHDAFLGLKTGPNWEFTYYSFVTISTLGYGDIQAVSYLARWLSVFEACIGLFFFGVLIALLLNSRGRGDCRNPESS